ncbi:MAG: sigma-54-dependent Fis family transcriptional regulator [Xanthomonadales bacterium]|nr:sigma-54-dependent Fis family transcriptional regulator [Xanthomonadales bacterium]
MSTVLVIDDNPAVGTALEVLLSLREIRTLTATTPEAGLAALATEPVDLVIQDMNFSADTTSGEEGVALFHAVRAGHPDLPIVLLTAWTHLETAIELVKAGAADYLAKPWQDDRLLTTVDNLIELAESARAARRFQDEQRQALSELADRYRLCGQVVVSRAMEQAVRLAGQVARSDLPVLIAGPNGAGKEGIAAIVHANSPVAEGPYVTVNCGALPAELIEAELFGAEAGAYTSAGRAREGRFEAADGGTLFLDEIGNLPLSGQVKLLRVLETGQFERLGSNRTRQVKVRLVSATNADLPAMIAAGGFREDLYYRLNVIEIKVPPLAQRREDILPLAEHFLERQARLSEGARRALLRHAWPGNVRELKNAVLRARLLCRDGVIAVGDLGLPAAPGAGPMPPAATVEPDRAAIEEALRRAGGVVSQAAGELGLSRQALYRRLDKLGLDPALVR